MNDNAMQGLMTAIDFVFRRSGFPFGAFIGVGVAVGLTWWVVSFFESKRLGG